MMEHLYETAVNSLLFQANASVYCLFLCGGPWFKDWLDGFVALFVCFLKSLLVYEELFLT